MTRHGVSGLGSFLYGSCWLPWYHLLIITCTCSIYINPIRQIHTVRLSLGVFSDVDNTRPFTYLKRFYCILYLVRDSCKRLRWQHVLISTLQSAYLVFISFLFSWISLRCSSRSQPRRCLQISLQPPNPIIGTLSSCRSLQWFQKCFHITLKLLLSKEHLFSEVLQFFQLYYKNISLFLSLSFYTVFHTTWSWLKNLKSQILPIMPCTPWHSEPGK